METREQKRQETKRVVAEAMKEDKGKQKVALSFKLACDIETSTDLKQVLESRILDSKVELTLREVLGIVKNFHKVIIDAIWRNGLVVEEMSGVNTVMIREEDEDTKTVLLAGVQNAGIQYSHEEVRSHYTRTH